jgi:hypothetical protein
MLRIVFLLQDMFYAYVKNGSIIGLFFNVRVLKYIFNFSVSYEFWVHIIQYDIIVG